METSKFKKFREKLKVALMIIKEIKNWPLFFLAHFKAIKEKHIVYYLRSGQKIKVMSGTMDWWFIVREIFIDKNYNPKGFELNRGDIVLDIGAHIGMFSVFASKFVSKVYSFEPIDDNFAILEENVKMNKIKNICPFKMAVYSESGKKELSVNNSNTCGHSFYLIEGESEKVMVQTISLEDFIIQNNVSKIDFLKMDCEGAEYDILLNCPKRILSKIKKISMECHNTDSSHNVFVLKTFLEENGFMVSMESNSCVGFHYLYAKK